MDEFGDGDGGPRVPKRGGGLDAFRSGEARMEGSGAKKLRWTKFKWIIFVTNTLVCFLYDTLFFLHPYLPPFVNRCSSTPSQHLLSASSSGSTSGRTLTSYELGTDPNSSYPLSHLALGYSHRSSGSQGS